MTEPSCDLCDNPTDGYVCARCSQITAELLGPVIELAPEVETNVARLARYAVRGGRRAVQADEDDEERGPSAVNRRQPVEAFGWPASKDRPVKGALRATGLIVDLNASSRAAHAFNTITTWARLVEDERGVLAAGVRQGEHPASVAVRFLLGQLEWLRHQPQADEANEQLRAAGAVVKRIVDRPADEEVVGRCDCGLWLYAFRGRSTVTCRCGLAWDVRESRVSLLEDMRDRLVTVAEAATLGVLAFPDLQRERVRKLVASWVRTDRPGHLISHPTSDGAAYSFGEILDRLSSHVVRFEERDRVNVSA